MSQSDLYKWFSDVQNFEDLAGTDDANDELDVDVVKTILSAALSSNGTDSLLVDSNTALDASAATVPVQESTPIAVDDSPPLSVDDTDPDVVQETVLASTSVASGSSTKASLSPPSGEVWEIIAFSHHFNITNGTTGDATSRLIIRDGADFSPAIIAHQSITQYGNEAWVGVGTQDAFRDGSGVPVAPSTATSLLVSDNGESGVYVPSTMQLFLKFANNTDASAGEVRCTALVRKHTVE